MLDLRWQNFRVGRRSLSRVVVYATVALLCLELCATGCSENSQQRSLVTKPLKTLTVAQRVDYLDTLAREPMVVEQPSGTLFVSGYNHRRPRLWRSTDTGRTWTRVDVGTEAQGAIGNSDVDLAVAPDGTLYFVSMGFDVSHGVGTSIAIGVSRDSGTSWRWALLSRERFVDRPWVGVAPDGTVHVIWNDGRGILHLVSHDAGATWIRTVRANNRGGSSHLAVGPNGEIAVRVTPGSASGHECDDGVDLIAVSTDAGATWVKHPAPGAPRPSGCGATPGAIPRWVDPIAWDANGSLYSLWTTATGVWLAGSSDQGASWTKWNIASISLPYFPYLVARRRGELAATWFSDVGDSIRWTAARITMRDDAGSPSVVISAATPLESSRGTPERPDPGGEYLSAILLEDGSVGVVTPIQHESAHRAGFTWWRFEPR